MCLISGQKRGGNEEWNNKVWPLPNGDASQRKFGNANLCRQTCDGWPNGLAKKSFQYSLAGVPVLKKTTLKPT